MDVAAWLQGLGLARYVPAFHDNEIDWETLPKLTAEDLKDLGVVLGGHRRKLLDAIAALDAEAPATGTAASRDAAALAGAERRQLTVMFCDLVGSTALSARLDPEDLRGIIGAYHRCVAETVEGFSGYVARYMGDGVLIYFGYPQAHEDDAERATRCGLAVIDRVSRLNLAEALHARVGIATGLVVVGGEVVEHDVFGETPNLAARLQALAEPDMVVIAASTRRLVGDLFEYRDLSAVELKGFTVPVPAWQVLRPSVIASRFEALRGSALSPLIGRDEEIELLLRRWTRAKTGDGQVVLISGEPGIGKSRTTTALQERLQAEPHIRLRYFCSLYHRDSALFPFIDQLERAAEFAHDDSPAARLEKLEAVLARAAPADGDVALLADLLCVPCAERCPLPNLSPQRKKERTLEALIRQLEGLARQQPVLMVFEDAHWIDPTSRELLDLTVERVRNLPVLLIVTFRPEFQPPWTGQPQVTMLALNRLDRHDRTVLIDQIVGGKELPDEVTYQIVERADGVPLFVEELTKSVLESGLLREEADRYVLDGALPPFAIPTTLHDSLMARLDRLASVRLVAQIGAAIGREFPYSLLRTVSDLPEGELQAALARLVASELVFQRGAPPDSVYAFKHALVQDAAYSSLLRSTRQQMHAQIAGALETQSPEIVESQPELLAQHCAEAGLIEKSVAYWGKAGRRSAGRSAMAEAAEQFQKALDQLAQLPDAPARQRQELELRSALCAVLQAVKGYAAPETGQAYARARELWEQLGSPSEFLQIPYGQSLYHAVRGELKMGLRLDEDLVSLSRSINDAAGLVLGHLSSGRHLTVTGGFALSRSHLEQAVALYNSMSDRSLVQKIVVQFEVASQAYLGNVLACLGFPETALTRSNAAIVAARRLAHLPSLSASLVYAARLHSLIDDNAGLGERADELVAIATERGFAHWGAQGSIYRGWVKVKNGDVHEGISLLRSGLTAYRTNGAEVWMTYHIALLARACEIAEQVEEALTLVDEALQIGERTGERWVEAELYRHKGQLLLRQGHDKTAEELYCKALGIATEQEAKLWELRAAASLARLRHDQGRRAVGRDLLAPVYGWFIEGFDMSDLKDAKALLDELA
ncbi:MAG: AAA family ATPase [Alphaproteobacteria bacterium]|nr:AAA family ATPase [Alphaproteobacteria bacterium]